MYGLSVTDTKYCYVQSQGAELESTKEQLSSVLEEKQSLEEQLSSTTQEK